MGQDKNSKRGGAAITARYNPTFKGEYLTMLRAEAEDLGVTESEVIRRRVIESLQNNPPFAWLKSVTEEEVMRFLKPSQILTALKSKP